MKRRTILKATAAATAATLTGGAGGYVLWKSRGEEDYREAVEDRYRPADLSLTDPALVLREIARYATMAPNSHNTQPWRILLERSALVLRPDFARRCPAVDPDDHHVFVSLGCAAENAVQAAAAYGMDAEVGFDEQSESIRIELDFASRRDPRGSTPPLFHAIPERQSTRADFDGSKLSPDELQQLLVAGSGTGVTIVPITDSEQMAGVLDFIVQGTRAQMRDPEFRAELRSWIRTSYREAIENGDGLFSLTSGFPALPVWIGKRMFDLSFTVDAEVQKYQGQVRSSAGIAVFIADDESKRGWTDVGRCFERFALQATSMGLLHSHLNQPLEVPELRKEFAKFLGLVGQRPDLVIRFGRGQPAPKSLRRHFREVVSEST